MDAILSIENVTFRYDAEDGRRILQDFSLKIGRGSFTVILGHNGSGKSTLAKLLNGLNFPESGHIYIDGLDAAQEENVMEVRRKVGMVFQNPDNQLVATIVEEDVAFGPENLGLEPDEIRRRVDDALRAVGMYEYRTHAPHKLSGGQKQRVAIAGILAMEPEVIVLDEPTAMLDPKGRRDVLEVLHRLNRERGVTVILITHYMEEAVEADRVLVLDGGKVALDGSPQQVFSQVEAIRAAGLEVPQPTELCYRLQQEGIDLPAGVITTDGAIEALTPLLQRAGVS